MLDQQTKKRIDDCRNILVGKITDPKSQVEQITIALIYKFMDDMDTEAIEMGGVPTYFVGEYERYSWKNIFSPRIGGDEMLSLYGEGMVKMNLNPSLPQLFRDIFKNAYLPYRDPETLKLFLKTINEFKYDHSERLGDAFEYLLSVLGSQGDAGQFRTPRHIIDFIVEIINPKKNESFMDPAAGTSGFLISGFKHILKNNTNKINGDKLTPDERKKLTQNITGFDISPDMVRLSLVNLFLHGFTKPQVYEYDTLTSEDRWNEYYDVILANPPFMSPKGGIRPHKRFGIESNRAEVLFVDYIMEHLTPKGRSGIVVPEGIIFQSGTAYKSLRKSLVEKYLVGVISLPSGVFQPYSGVKTSILILDKELSQKTDKIFFGKVDSDGFDLGSQRREIEKSDLPIITKEVTQYLEGLRNGKVVQSEKLTYVPKEQILTSSDLGLSYDRYAKKEIINSSFPLFELKEVVDFKRGTSITKKDVTEGNIPVIAGGQNPAYLHNEYNRIGETITVSSSGAYSGFVNFFNTPIFASDCFTISPKDENTLRTKFLFHLLKSRQLEIYSRQVGGGQPHIYPKSFDGFEIPLPPIEVQEEIVRELEQYQKIIDGAKQVVDNYKPVIDIDPSWEMKELQSICTKIGDGLHGTPKYTENGEYHFINGNNLLDDIIKIKETTKRVSKEEYNKYKKDLTDRTILISINGTLGNVSLYNNEKVVLGKSVCYVNIINAIEKQYIKIYLQSSTFNEYAHRVSTGSTIQNVSLQSIRSFPIPIPPNDIQNEIVERIESERRIIEGNKKLIEIYTRKIQDRINKIWGN
jgi:type I restriction enzyme M protein